MRLVGRWVRWVRGMNGWLHVYFICVFGSTLVWPADSKTGDSQLDYPAGVNGRFGLAGYLILSNTINTNNSGRYKTDTKNNCRARGMVN